MSEVEKVQRLLTDPGELVRFAAIAFRTGGARIYFAAAGVLGAVLAAGQSVPAHFSSLVLPNRVIVALTDRRLLVYSVGGVLVAAPKKILYAFDRSDLVGMEQPYVTGSVAAVLRVSVLIKDGTVLGVEFPYLSHDQGAGMLQELARGMGRT